MKLTAREDIEAPLAMVFEHLTDFAHFQTAAQRRGAEVERRDTPEGPVWQINFVFRNRLRKLSLTQIAHEAPHRLAFNGVGKSVEGTMEFDLVSLGQRRTRLSATLDIKPRTLAARLFLQSLKLARGRVQKRYRNRIAQLAAHLEQRIKASAA
jgi:carbon monoxide dehydrogenase subunit G